ncbi:MAG: hypothetical protein RIT04_22 [Candidatus Parcubacteria bacterium]|jgi:alanine racemase
MKQLLKRLRHRIKALKPASEPLITITVSKGALLNNLAYFAAKTPHGTIAPVLKSNAYGHGLTLIAKMLEKSSVSIPFFVIDSYFEAAALRSDGIKKPLLIIAYTTAKTIAQNNLSGVTYTVTSMDTLEKLSLQKLHKTKINLKIDTAMNRQGISVHEIDTAIAYIKKMRGILLEGICSHFSESDITNSPVTAEQIKQWNIIVQKFRTEFPTLTYWHLSNTDGHLLEKKITSNVSRLGLGLYTQPSPVLQMETIITGIRKIRVGEKVGYNGTFVAQKDMTIAIIPVGYFEGIDRRLSGKGTVMVMTDSELHQAPMIGRVSMNITTIDISHIPNVSIGSRVVVYGRNTHEINTLEKSAEICGTISRELMVHIPAHLKRIQIS